MGLILCEDIVADKPYYVEELDINIYSIEELGYILYEHPLLVMEDFISTALFDFIKTELKKESLAISIEKMYAEKISDENIIIYILETLDFYKSSEISRYKNLITNYRKLKRVEFLKAKADYMFGIKRYGKAIRFYSIICKQPPDRNIADKFQGKIWHNMGSAYANLFLYEKALEAYKKSFEYLKDNDILKKIYFLSKLGEDEVFTEFLDDNGIEIIDASWDEEYNETLKKALASQRIDYLDSIMKKDSYEKRLLINELAAAWKQEYRNML